MQYSGETKIIIDLGNTLAKIAVFRGNSLFTEKVFKTGSYKNLVRFLNSQPIGSYCIVSGVVDFPAGFEKIIKNNFKTIVLDENTPIPLKNSYKTPGTLGNDRIAAAVAAWNEFPGRDILVIDAGTAVTTDLVSSKGEFYGGAISPGIDMRFKALHTFTGRLPLVKRTNIKYLTGTTTVESISSGVINGLVAEIDGIIDKYKLLYPEIISVFGGGDSIFLLKRLKNSIFARSNPVLNGLHLILNYNIENKQFS
jgi:type III pantothenate kinase